jgi:hypothetical protein
MMISSICLNLEPEIKVGGQPEDRLRTKRTGFSLVQALAARLPLKDGQNWGLNIER